MAHGAGGTVMHDLVRKYVLKYLGEWGAEVPLEALKETKEGKEAQVIGEATRQFNEVVLETIVGGKRILAPPIGDPIPRIC